MGDPCSVTNAVVFVKKYQADAEKLAKQIDVPAENILGLAAHESEYGKGRFAVEGNNFFSLHAPAPMQIGEIAAKGNLRLKVAKFSSFFQCGQSFLARFGSGLRGKKDPKEFSAALVAIHFNTGNAKTGGRDGYAKLVEDTIIIVKKRALCKTE